MFNCSLLVEIIYFVTFFSLSLFLVLVVHFVNFHCYGFIRWWLKVSSSLLQCKHNKLLKISSTQCTFDIIFLTKWNEENLLLLCTQWIKMGRSKNKSKWIFPFHRHIFLLWFCDKRGEAKEKIDAIVRYFVMQIVPLSVSSK